MIYTIEAFLPSLHLYIWRRLKRLAAFWEEEDLGAGFDLWWWCELIFPFIPFSWRPSHLLRRSITLESLLNVKREPISTWVAIWCHIPLGLVWIKHLESHASPGNKMFSQVNLFHFYGSLLKLEDAFFPGIFLILWSRGVVGNTDDAQRSCVLAHNHLQFLDHPESIASLNHLY